MPTSSIGFLKVCPKFFQKLMTKVLRGTAEFACSIADNIAIFSETWEQHNIYYTTRENCFRQIERSHLTANKRKCQFCLQCLSILGYTVSSGFLTASQDKVEAILKLVPAKKKQRSASTTRHSWFLSQLTTTLC